MNEQTLVFGVVVVAMLITVLVLGIMVLNQLKMLTLLP